MTRATPAMSALLRSGPCCPCLLVACLFCCATCHRYAHAQVPWLDDEDVDERELRGLVAVGLLGTLEEVGWQLRDKLLALWSGERDLDVLTADVGPKEAAALQSILYHMQQLEAQFGRPTEKGVAAAIAAAAGGAVDSEGGTVQ